MLLDELSIGGILANAAAIEISSGWRSAGSTQDRAGGHSCVSQRWSYRKYSFDAY